MIGTGVICLQHMISAGDPGQEALSVGKITKSRMGSHSLPIFHAKLSILPWISSGTSAVEVVVVEFFFKCWLRVHRLRNFVSRRANLASRVVCTRLLTQSLDRSFFLSI